MMIYNLRKRYYYYFFFFIIIALLTPCSINQGTTEGDQLNGRYYPCIGISETASPQLPLEALMVGESEITYICGLYRKGRWAPLTRTTK